MFYSLVHSQSVPTLSSLATKITIKPRMVVYMSCFYMPCNVDLARRSFLTNSTMPSFVTFVPHAVDLHGHGVHHAVDLSIKLRENI